MATISTVYTITATHPTGREESMTQETQKAAAVYAGRASLRGYEVVVIEKITRGDEVSEREFLRLAPEVKPPFGDAWERKAALQK